MTVMNIIFAITDTIICGLAIVGMCMGAYHFDRWWILLFTIVPLLLFNSHTLVLDVGKEEQKEGGAENG